CRSLTEKNRFLVVPRKDNKKPERRSAAAPGKWRRKVAATRATYDFVGGSFCLGAILARAASMSGGRAVTGALEAPVPPLLGPPKKRMVVAARPSIAPPPFPLLVTSTSGTNFALPSASAVTTLTIAVAFEPSASTCAR